MKIVIIFDNNNNNNNNVEKNNENNNDNYNNRILIIIKGWPYSSRHQRSMFNQATFRKILLPSPDGGRSISRNVA